MEIARIVVEGDIFGVAPARPGSEGRFGCGEGGAPATRIVDNIDRIVGAHVYPHDVGRARRVNRDSILEGVVGHDGYPNGRFGPGGIGRPLPVIYVTVRWVGVAGVT